MNRVIGNLPITSDRKRRYKETEDGQRAMTEIMERIVKEEREEAKAEGKALVNKLNSILISMKRFDDLERCTYDTDYQEQLIIELLPNEMQNA